MNETNTNKDKEHRWHNVCQEMLKKHGGKAKCCECNNHKCKDKEGGE